VLPTRAVAELVLREDMHRVLMVCAWYVPLAHGALQDLPAVTSAQPGAGVMMAGGTVKHVLRAPSFLKETLLVSHVPIDIGASKLLTVVRHLVSALGALSVYSTFTTSLSGIQIVWVKTVGLRFDHGIYQPTFGPARPKKMRSRCPKKMMLSTN